MLDTARSLTGTAPPRWDRTGSSRVRGVPVVDPDLVRQLDVGQAAYIYRGGVTYVQVKRLVAKQAALPAAEPAVAAVPAQRTHVRQTALPDVSSLLDEAFPPRSLLGSG